MKIFVRICLVAAAAGLVFWLWTIFFPNPEAVIRKRLDKVAALVSFGAKEGNIAKAASVMQLTSYFATNVEITVDTPAQSKQTLSGRDELTQAALAARNMLSGLNVEFLDQSIILSPDKLSATVSLTGKARVPGDRDLLVQELKFYLQKINGDWLIVRIETVRTLT
jgi:hypothetical protein